MNAFTPEEAVPVKRGLWSSLTTAFPTLSAWFAAARAWRWGSVLGRVVLAALGLLVLGAIGRSAIARNALLSDPSPTPDAGSVASPMASAAPMASPPAAAPPPAASVGVLATSTAVLTDNAAPVSGAVPTTSGPAAASARSRATPEDPVYLNEATVADLHRLPGVGAKRAEAILALRTRLGHFRQVEDLLKVKGIGRSSLKKLRPLIRLDPPPMKSGDAGAVDGHARYDSAPFTRAISAPTAPSLRSMCS